MRYDVYIYIYLDTYQQMVSVHHPLGLNWHPFEGAGIYIFIYLDNFRYIYNIYIYDIPKQQSQPREMRCWLVWNSIGGSPSVSPNRWGG